MPECIVLGDRSPMGLYFGEDYARGGSLLFGDHATVFPNRRRALRAIERTRKHHEASFGAGAWDVQTRIVNVKPLAGRAE